MIEIKIYGEVENVMAELRALAGGVADPQPAAARATRSKSNAETSTPTPAAPVPAAPATAAPSTPSADTAGPVATSSAGPTATIAAPPSEAPALTQLVADAHAQHGPVGQVPVTEADITAAANAAAAKLGASGPAKIKAHIGSKFTKPDGTPGTLKTTRPEQHALLLADLQAIARGELTLA